MARPRNTKYSLTVRKRKDCARFELIIRDPTFGRFYGGLFKTKKEAFDFVKNQVKK